MKRVSLLALWVLAFFLIAAPIYMQYNNLIVNGKPFGRAAFVNGMWAMPLEDFSRAIGGNGVTLEPTLKLNGNTLSVLVSSNSPAQKGTEQVSEVKVKAYDPANVKQIVGTPTEQVKMQSHGIIAIRKAGGVSNNVFGFNGQKWVPLADVARAFGATFTAPAGNLPPGQTLTLNFANKPDAVLGFSGGV